jgi:hypothetical protein
MNTDNFMLCEHFNLVPDSKNGCSKEWEHYPAEFEKTLAKVITDICKKKIKYILAFTKCSAERVKTEFSHPALLLNILVHFSLTHVYYYFIHNSHLTVPLSSPEAKRFSSMFSKQYNGLLKQRVHFSCSGFPSNATLF